MPKQAKPKKEKSTFEEKDVHIIREEETQNRKTVLRTVRWVVDGKDTGIKLEKRAYFVKDGQVKSGRMVGLNKSDLEYLMSNFDEVLMMMV